MVWTFPKSRPAHRPSPFGADWTQSFHGIFGLGLDGSFFYWAGWTGFLLLPAGMDWSGLDEFLYGPGLFWVSGMAKMT